MDDIWIHFYSFNSQILFIVTLNVLSDYLMLQIYFFFFFSAKANWGPSFYEVAVLTTASIRCGKQEVSSSKKKVSSLSATISMTLLRYNMALFRDIFPSVLSLWRGVITADYMFRLDTKMKIIQPDVCLTLRVTRSFHCSVLIKELWEKLL